MSSLQHGLHTGASYKDCRVQCLGGGIAPQSACRCSWKLHALHNQAIGRRACLLSLGSSPWWIKEGGAAENIRDTYNKAAETYDGLDDGAIARALGLNRIRRELLSGVHGTVLEVAVGTGINLPLYNAEKVEKYLGIDLSSQMLQQASQKLAQLPLANKAVIQEGDVEGLPFADQQFDFVISTFSMCVFQNPAQALQEMKRVLKSNGRVLLFEHSRSNFQPLGIYQDLTAGAVAKLSKGCVWNQKLNNLISDAGLHVVQSEPVLGGLFTVAELRR